MQLHVDQVGRGKLYVGENQIKGINQGCSIHAGIGCYAMVQDAQSRSACLLIVIIFFGSAVLYLLLKRGQGAHRSAQYSSYRKGTREKETR